MDGGLRVDEAFCGPVSLVARASGPGSNGRCARSGLRGIAKVSTWVLLSVGGFRVPTVAAASVEESVHHRPPIEKRVAAAAVGTVVVGGVVTGVSLARRETRGDDVTRAARWARRVLDETWLSKKRRSMATDLVPPQDDSSIGSFLVPVTNDLDKAIQRTLEGEPSSTVQETIKQLGYSKKKAKTAFRRFGRAQVSKVIDRIARNIDSDDFTTLASLNVLAAVLGRLREVGRECFSTSPEISYAGAALQPADVQKLYRRYVGFCLSTEQRLREDYETLKALRFCLGMEEAQAKEIIEEMAKSVFQVAISSVMYKGTLNKERRDVLTRLRTSFSTVLDEELLDKIISEVSVMRVLHELQKLIHEEKVSQEKLDELQRMCKDLDVRVEEVLQSVNDLASALGPEAKEFVESLKALLSGATSMDAAARPNQSHR
eukprot:CAMPEP_0113971258 /NCGR_PEP_ID=MMETSP0011_2-20120614/12115_1 /TAXON_ID=101924 /ORGANISM="Rhodosorus marinus" /LENGTH=430 /DNA_ID=CAMNT_0000986691 /DNA_START=541 /DNA_END=1833 /DNA_ORIENTATION=- /assembly_acc=CAM_ASM_000156